MGSFDNRVVLITGAGSGIGRATARIMARAGAKVAIVDCNREGGDETAGMIAREGSRAKVWEGDVTDYSGMAKIVRRVEEAFEQDRRSGQQRRGRLGSLPPGRGDPGDVRALHAGASRWHHLHHPGRVAGDESAQARRNRQSSLRFKAWSVIRTAPLITPPKAGCWRLPPDGPRSSPPGRYGSTR